MAQAVISPVPLELVYKYFLFATKCFDEKTHPTQNTAGLGKLGISAGFGLSVLLGELAEHSNCIILVPVPSPCSKLEQI